MKCDYCQKNEATSLLKQKINGQSRILHICDSCASSMLFSNLFGDFSLSSISPPELSTHKTKKSCPSCGTTLDDIMGLGKVGCDHCYDIFRQELSRSIEKMHGKAKHIGKIPRSASGKIHRQKLLENLRAELAQLVASQEFEKAAEVRDKIKAVEASEHAVPPTNTSSKEGESNEQAK